HNVSGEYYRHILQAEVLFTRVILLLPKPTNFVQGNASAHRAKATTKFVKTLSLQDLKHPPQSPDPNPIKLCLVWNETSSFYASRFAPMMILSGSASGRCLVDLTL
ncbi:putative traNSPOSABLE ELEMENT-RELATED, partial [Phytophthora infestans]